MFKFNNAFHTKNKQVGMQFTDQKRVVSIYPDVKGIINIDCSEKPVTQEEGVEITKHYNRLVRFYK